MQYDNGSTRQLRSSKIGKMNATAIPYKRLMHFGFNFGRGGAHTSRTMMLEELEALLAYVHQPEAVKADYLRAIKEDNCLGKRSGKTRTLTCRHLVDLYALDPSVTLFRALRFFWQRDTPGASRSWHCFVPIHVMPFCA